jgi:hypothetical protein
MILIRTIIDRILNEVLSYSQLMKFSDPVRKKRGEKMRVRSLPVTATSTNEFWNFSYKSDPSHITSRPNMPNGISHKGRISFKKINENNQSAIDIPCSVDCSCEDYRYKWAYANSDKDAGEIGKQSLSQCNGSYPRVTNPHLRPGLCIHLISLRGYLKTKLEESQQPTLHQKLDEIVFRYPTGIIEFEE